MSNASLSRAKWRIALGMMIILVVGIAMLAAALTLGAANPPHAPMLRLATTAPAPTNPLPVPPYTLKLLATNQGPADSIWGFWIGNDVQGALTFVADGSGYFSVTQNIERDWTQFIHLKPQANALFLNVEADGAGTLRINGEIAWKGAVPPANHWGMVADGTAQLSDLRAALFDAAS